MIVAHFAQSQKQRTLAKNKRADLNEIGGAVGTLVLDRMPQGLAFTQTGSSLGGGLEAGRAEALGDALAAFH